MFLFALSILFFQLLLLFTLIIPILFALFPFPSDDPEETIFVEDETVDDENPEFTARIALQYSKVMPKSSSTPCIYGGAWDDQSLKEGCSGVSHSSIPSEAACPDRNWEHSASGRVEIPSNNTTLWTFRIDEKDVMFCGILAPSIRRGSPLNASIHFNDVDDLTGTSYFLGRFSTPHFLIRVFSCGTHKEVAQIKGKFEFPKYESQGVCDQLSGWDAHAPSRFHHTDRIRLSGRVEVPSCSNARCTILTHKEEMKVSVSASPSPFFPANANISNADMSFHSPGVSVSFTYHSATQVAIVEGHSRRSVTDAVDVIGAGPWVTS